MDLTAVDVELPPDARGSELPADIVTPIGRVPLCCQYRDHAGISLPHGWRQSVRRLQGCLRG